MANPITYSDAHDVPRDQILALYRANQWSSAKRPDELCKGLANSATLITAWDNDLLVGLGNALTDGHLVVYFSHLLVHPDYHRRGIGTEIVKQLKDAYAGFHQQILVAEDHAIAFYESCGFGALGDKTPMAASDGGEHG
jgi:GNAT superfamily N-acetyltransferase